VETCNAFDDDCDGVIDNGTDAELCGASGMTCVKGQCVAGTSGGGSGGASGTGGGNDAGVDAARDAVAGSGGTSVASSGGTSGGSRDGGSGGGGDGSSTSRGCAVAGTPPDKGAAWEVLLVVGVAGWWARRRGRRPQPRGRSRPAWRRPA
jgi:hypothetical protein